jgi:hypothetical protein
VYEAIALIIAGPVLKFSTRDGPVLLFSCPRRNDDVVSELFSMEECDQAVVDFLAATEVGKFPPK